MGILIDNDNNIVSLNELLIQLSNLRQSGGKYKIYVTDEDEPIEIDFHVTNIYQGSNHRFPSTPRDMLGVLPIHGRRANYRSGFEDFDGDDSIPEGTMMTFTEDDTISTHSFNGYPQSPDNNTNTAIRRSSRIIPFNLDENDSETVLYSTDTDGLSPYTSPLHMVLDSIRRMQITQNQDMTVITRSLTERTSSLIDSVNRMLERPNISRTPSRPRLTGLIPLRLLEYFNRIIPIDNRSSQIGLTGRVIEFPEPDDDDSIPEGTFMTSTGGDFSEDISELDEEDIPELDEEDIPETTSQRRDVHDLVYS